MKLKSTLTSSFIICVSLLFSFKIKAQAINTQDSLALVDFYNSTDGPHWFTNTNWLTTQPVSSWYGITVTNGRVTFIGLADNELSGTLSSSIGNLTALQYLAISGNHITGTIPESVGNLNNLLWLVLYANQFSGTIPASIGNLSALSTLQLHANNLTGTIPESILNLHGLQVLELENNQLSGNIPPGIGRLSNLVILNLDNNQFTGAIPDSIGNLSSILELHISGNPLSGSIPASIGNLPKIQELYLFSDHLSGEIPASLANVKTLSYLILSDNKLRGTLAGFKNLTNLITLDVSYNHLTQKTNINLDASLFPFLYNISLNNNNFTFSGIESLIATYQHKIAYASQAIIPVHQHNNVLAVSAGGTLSKNTYTWFKVESAGSTVITGDSVFHPSASGNYYVHVKNSVATRLTLISDTVTYTLPVAQNESNAASKNFEASLSIYPNPVRDNLLHVQCNRNTNITILNASGKVMLLKNISGNTTINLSAFSAGIYYLKSNNNNKVEKFEVVH